jgi:hypothetical protein
MNPADVREARSGANLVRWEKGAGRWFREGVGGVAEAARYAHWCDTSDCGFQPGGHDALLWIDGACARARRRAPAAGVGRDDATTTQKTLTGTWQKTLNVASGENDSAPAPGELTRHRYAVHATLMQLEGLLQRAGGYRSGACGGAVAGDTSVQPSAAVPIQRCRPCDRNGQRRIPWRRQSPCHWRR